MRLTGRAGGLLLFAGFLLSAAPAPAVYRFDTIRTEPASGIEIEVVSLYDRIPPLGHLPVSVSIRNGSARTRSWTLHFEGPNYTARSVFRRSVEVEAGGFRRLEMQVPVLAQNDSWAVLELTVTGYGVTVGRDRLTAPYVPGEHGTAFAGISAALALRSAGPIEAAVQEQTGKTRTLNYTVLDPALFPTDWRGLMGLDSVWMTREELAKLVPEAKRALSHWVLQGGELRVCQRPAESAAPLPLPIPQTAAGHYGFGDISFQSWDGRELPADDTARRMIEGRRRRNEFEQTARLFGLVDEAEIHRPVLLGFLALFGLAIGPVNFFMLARGRRRMRLLVTTPVISLTASLVFVVLILFQEGTGGSGRRFVISLLEPETHTEFRLQEQVSRTGMLLGRSYTLETGVSLSPIFSPLREFSLAGDSPRRLERGENRFDGDWFEPRSVQAQLLAEIRPSRARVELLNPGDAASSGAAPKLRSRLAVAAATLLFRDEQGGSWVAHDVAPGETVETRFLETHAFARELERMTDPFPALTGAPLHRDHPRAGYFYADAKQGQAPVIATLAAIDWRDEAALLLGPVVPVY